MAGGFTDKGGRESNLDITSRPLLRAFRATLAYDGSGFVGSQLQKDGRTVLAEVNRALGTVLAHPVRVKVASRTDAGVHATGQVIAFRTSAPRTADEIRRALNGLLPGDIRLTDCRETDFSFHPRHSAVGKVYLYRILRARELPPTSRHYVLFIEQHKPFDLGRLRELARQLEGERDFRSFSPRLEAGANPVKTIRRVGIRDDAPLVEIRFIGSGFLYQMVRRMTGLMIAIIQGRERGDSLKKALEHPETGAVRYNASPRGLFLERVMYSEDEMRAAVEELVGS
jgi:tRNA pseudouridine38-40 synthase